MELTNFKNLFRYNPLIQDAIHRLYWYKQLDRYKTPTAGPYKGKEGYFVLEVVQLYNVNKPKIEELYNRCRRVRALRAGPLTAYQERTYKKIFYKQILNLINDWYDVYKWLGVPLSSMFEFIDYDNYTQYDLIEPTSDVSIETVRSRIFDYINQIDEINPTDYNTINFTIDMLQQIIKSSLYTYNAFYYWVEPKKTNKEILNDARRIKQLERAQ